MNEVEEMQKHMDKSFEYFMELEHKRVLCVSQSKLISKQHDEILKLKLKLAEVEVESINKEITND